MHKRWSKGAVGALLGLSIAAAAIVVGTARMLVNPAVPGSDGRTVSRLVLADAGIGQAYVERQKLEVLRGLLPRQMALSGAFAMSLSLENSGTTVSVSGELVLPGYFDALGVPIHAGQGFLAGGFAAPSPAEVVVSQRIERLLGFPAERLVGRSLRINGRDYRVVGTVADAFSGVSPQAIDVWMPLGAFEVDGLPVGQYTNNIPALIAAPDASALTSALAVMNANARQQAILRESEVLRTAPLTGGADPIRASSFTLSLPALQFLAWLMFAFALTSSIAILALHALKERRELAIRHLLGATRVRLIADLCRQVLWFLVLVTGVFLLSFMALLQFVRTQSATLSLLGLDIAGMLTATFSTWGGMLGLSLTAGFLLSWAVVGGSIGRAVQRVAARAVGRRTMAVVVVLKSSVAALFLFLAGGLLHAWIVGLATPVGVATDGYSVLYTDHDRSRQSVVFESTSRTRQLLDATLRLLSRDGRLRVAASTSYPGMAVVAGDQSVTVAAAHMPEHEITAQPVHITDGFFELAGVPLLAGSGDGFERDRNRIFVTAVLARQLWGTPAAAIGELLTLREPGDVEEVRVAGVVGDMLLHGIDASPPALVFRPASLSSSQRWVFLVEEGHGFALRDIADVLSRHSDGIVPTRLINAEDLPTLLTDDRASRASVGMATAALIAVSSLFGVALLAAVSARQRQREFAIRLCIGESPSRLARSMFGQFTAQVIAGLLFGTVVLVPLSLAAFADFQLGIGRNGILVGLAVQWTLLFGAMLMLLPQALKIRAIEPVPLLREGA